ncbi:MAG: ATP-dependent helicase UvrD/PcrA, partial [Patescibacteria group bacterium]|nr:ATP-dependent helicase UvrD/PcrA [Patescibacteria group bacterium]
MPKVISSPVFDKSYKGLNPEQKDAVDTIHGPVMVIAGPGTGKTTLLTLRIANILKETDASASSILALTFTESAVSSMRQKLFGIIGTDAYRVQINTFHGFANDIIRRYPEYFPRIIGSRNIREIEIIKMIREIIDANDFAHIKPFGSPFHYVRDAVKSIQSLKREGVTPEKFIENVELSSRPAPDGVHNVDDLPSKKDADVEVRTLRNKELATVYKAYEAMLTERKLYDFDDMLLDVVAALRDNDTLRATLQERFQFILADEHQDANASQNAILELLCSFDDKPNLLIVGDEKQAIFRFQGASLENFLYFKRKFPSAKVIFLTSNYRSGQPILDAAHSLITKGSLPADAEHLRKPLIANTKDSANIRVVATSSEKEERAFIVAELRTAQETGVPWEEIAIIYR